MWKDLNKTKEIVALKTFSYFDTGKQPTGAEPKQFYHGFAFEGKKVLTG